MLNHSYTLTKTFYLKMSYAEIYTYNYMAVLYRLFDTEKQWDLGVADTDRREVEMIVP